jgi:hypothetical protein
MPPLNPFTRSCLALAIGQAVLVPAHAATITVNSNLDNGTGCTLREAIAQANNTVSLTNGCVTGSIGTDTIDFVNDLDSNTIILSGSELLIDGKNIEINASSISGGITVDANNLSRVLSVQSSATLTLDSLTITGGDPNYLVGGDFARFWGGGVYAGSSASVSLNNSTVSGNSADSAGGINAEFASVSLNNSTVSGNTATSGGGIFAYSSSVSLSNSVVANSLNSSDCVGSTITIDLATIIEDQSCGAQRYGDPGLLQLADNGGPTLTHALEADSIAIGTGNPLTCEANDQRGEQRDEQCDVGSYEFIDDSSLDDSGMFVVPLKNGKAVIFEL